MMGNRLDHLLDHFIGVGVPGCSLAISYKGEIVYTGYRGLARLEDRKELDNNTIFQMFSNTKNVTTTAVMMLYEKGLFLLNDPVEKYLPCFKNSTYQTYDGSGEIHVLPVTRPMSIKDLLMMTSGIPYGGRGSMTQYDYSVENLGFEAAFSLPVMELAKKISGVPLEFDPGTHWRYGLGYDVLGALVEAVSGKKFGKFLEEEIFKPLGMKSTTFVLKKEMKPDLASIYTLDNGKQINTNFIPCVTDENGKLGESGGGGLLSTLDDMIKFATMWAMGGSYKGKRILGRNTIDLIRENHLAGGPLADFETVTRNSYPWFKGYGYGLGVRTLTSRPESGSNGSLGEFGWVGAAGTYLLADPEKELGIMYMHQLLPVVGNLQDYCHPRIRNVVYAYLDEWVK